MVMMIMMMMMMMMMMIMKKNCFVVWVTGEIFLDLIPVRAIVRDSHHHKSPTHREQDLNLRITWVQNFMNEFFLSILWFRSIVLVYKGYTVQNNMSIKIELYSNDSHKTTGARLNGHSFCNQLLSFSQTFSISA